MALNKLDTRPFGPCLEIVRYRLDNGLELLVSPDRSAPVVCYQTWFSVGSRHERRGKTGMAHLLEHLMFQQTERLEPGAYDRLLEEAGAENNAATFLDWTFYTVSLPADALPLVIELEAERMHHLVLGGAGVASEREVVANERRQTVDDDVDGSMAEALYLTAFERHGYRWPTIGLMEDIHELSAADCRAFYRSYYAPNNARVVVVGDVDLSALQRQLVQHYGAIPRAPVPPEVQPPEPAQQGERRVRVDKPAAAGRLQIGYRCPALGDAEAHASLVLANEILLGGRSSRGHRRLVDELELCSAAHGWVGQFRDPALYEVHLAARRDVELRGIEEAFYGLVGELAASPVDDRELARAVARIELSALQGLETVAGRAEQIGFAQTVLGDATALLDRLATYRSLSAADVQQAVQRELVATRRTVVQVEPGADEVQP